SKNAGDFFKGIGKGLLEIAEGIGYLAMLGTAISAKLLLLSLGPANILAIADGDNLLAEANKNLDGIIVPAAKGLGSAIIHPEDTLERYLNDKNQMYNKNGMAYMVGYGSVDVASIFVAGGAIKGVKTFSSASKLSKVVKVENQASKITTKKTNAKPSAINVGKDAGKAGWDYDMAIDGIKMFDKAFNVSEFIKTTEEFGVEKDSKKESR
ncbi:MAG: hypothetical protein ACRCUS_00510, partial [Anaerovoracaceae bacterium]